MAGSSIIWVSASASQGGNGSAESPYKTIQQAVDNAGPGTTIMVREGTYTENVKVRVSGMADAPITIVSADGAGKAVIKPASSSYDTIAIGGVDYVVIDGFTIHAPNSVMNGVAIYAKWSTTTFDPASHITVQNNTIIGGPGDGIKGSKAEYVYLLNNTISGTTGEESGIDFVGVNHAVISGNILTEISKIAIMLKGGSQNLVVEGNHIDGTGSSGIEVGGYTLLSRYWPGFLENFAYEVKDVVVSGNEIFNTGSTGLRLIGAQNVQVTRNEIRNVGNYIVSIDDSSMFHEVWLSSDVHFEGNSFEATNWLKNRSAGTNITSSDNFTDGRNLDTTAAESPIQPSEPPSPPQIDSLYLTGGAGRDELTGEDGDDTLIGNAGNDRLQGAGGADHLVGGVGDDYLDGGDGNDRLDGGDGSDRMKGGADDDWMSGGAGNDTIDGGAGKDIMEGGDGNDRMKGGAGDDWMSGGRQADELDGGDGNDWLDGGEGDDELDGGRGNDVLLGGPGADKLYGGSGDDILVGGEGDDTLKGGSGDDQFVFRGEGGIDRISDFSRADDVVVIDIEGVDSFADISLRANSKGEAVVYVDGAGDDLGLVTLADTKVSQLNADHFFFL